ncbi:DNA adenine methylase [Paenibacillus sp. FSL F4-0243]|uniref:DNA adenine methylase n=1 Tax=Paenibacillus sp. FSL F4-0243 TaxID=2954732 RepID=UPI0030DA7D8A
MAMPRILHYPGSKWSLAEWIISHMPQHTTYLEPFFGSGAVFFNKKPSSLETINDLDGEVVNLFKIIRDNPDELAHLVQWTPYSRQEYYSAYGSSEELDEMERARLFLVRCWMARGGKTSDRTGWKHNIDVSKSPNNRMPDQWAKVPEKIMAVTERLKEVQIEQQPALKLIERYKVSSVLIYADPPYLLSTRSKRLYRNEMKDEDHIEMLNALDDHPGPVILSGYDHPMYNERLKHWRREEKQALAEMGRIRTEVLWINPVAAEYSRQLTLF